MLDEAQQQCVNRLNYDAAKLAKEQGNENLRCLQRATRSKLSPGQTADDCLVADAKGRIAHHQDGIERDFDFFCSAPLPPFGLPSGTVTTTSGTVPREQSVALVGDIFGPSLGASALDCNIDPAGCACQAAVSKAYEKLAVSNYKIFLHCKKVYLNNLLFGGSATLIQKCVDSLTFAESIESANSAKLRLRLQKLTYFVSRKCAGVDTAVALPGACAGLTDDALGICISERIRCRICLTVSRIDNVTIDCDQFDDHQVNASCSAD